ncbi:MAG: D-alanyl-D-alanine carboxypeptidase [Alphaproteobacteria bacterium]|nr:D-alanyl-D-alanine carboxypeptidase [Alphaproteobacteria bacterium]
MRTLCGLSVVFVVASLAVAAGAESISTRARHAVLIDTTTDTVLLDKASDVPMPPASMSKLMTIYMVFDRLKSGRVSMDDQFLVSEKAWRKGGSKMFVRVNTRVSVRDLLRGIIVQSGNDACIVIAEGLAGSEEAFAEQMNRRAREIGLTESSFKNATGWPAEGHVMSARDIARLSSRLIQDFPEYYKMFAEVEFTYNGIKQGNRNPLLYKNFGADGLKTGHTEASGFGLAASAVRDGRRLLLVVNGLDSMRERSSESARLLDWAFRETATYALFKKGDVVDRADVWLGVEKSVPLVIDRDLALTMPRRARGDMKAKVVFNNPVPAPVRAGTPIARLVVTAEGQKPLELPLVAGKDIEQLGLFGRLGAAIRHLVYGAAG